MNAAKADQATEGAALRDDAEILDGLPARARVAFVQHGDYGATVKRFERGEGETYYAQRYSVDIVAGMARACEGAMVVCLNTAAYDERLASGVHAVGVERADSEADVDGRVADVLSRWGPTHLVLRTPKAGLLRWALASRETGVRTLPMFADSFRTRLRDTLRHRRLSALLNDPRIELVGNHNVPACRSLVRIGVREEKVIPWDWPPAVAPERAPVRSLPAEGEAVQLLFVGVHSEMKGTGDVVRALGRLRAAGVHATLTCIGSGDAEAFGRLAEELGVSGAVRFLGVRDHDETLATMRSHHFVVVPSHRKYPEGMPFTIYDALSCRTPLVVSDHPMFTRGLRDREAALFFRAGEPGRLAERVQEIAGDAGLYRSLSEGAPAAFRKLVCPNDWGEIVQRWIRDGDEDKAWLAARTLRASGVGSYEARPNAATGGDS